MRPLGLLHLLPITLLPVSLPPLAHALATPNPPSHDLVPRIPLRAFGLACPDELRTVDIQLAIEYEGDTAKYCRQQVQKPCAGEGAWNAGAGAQGPPICHNCTCTDGQAAADARAAMRRQFQTWLLDELNAGRDPTQPTNTDTNGNTIVDATANVSAPDSLGTVSANAPPSEAAAREQTADTTAAEQDVRAGNLYEPASAWTGNPSTSLVPRAAALPRRRFGSFRAVECVVVSAAAARVRAH
ncbi:MAG: hypothetical protein M1838_000521 [Thelocarpon superellum]|nr:MAG: hypothetical protein M1838_000521 [Thelocarpon superellum]